MNCPCENICQHGEEWLVAVYITHNNQLTVTRRGNMELGEEASRAGIVWGSVVPLFGSSNQGGGNKEKKIHVGLRWLPMDVTRHNNQPETGGCCGGV